jgi:hypothetical protein
MSAGARRALEFGFIEPGAVGELVAPVPGDVEVGGGAGVVRELGGCAGCGLEECPHAASDSSDAAPNSAAVAVPIPRLRMEVPS